MPLLPPLPSSSFALETALLTALARERGTSLLQLLLPTPAPLLQPQPARDLPGVSLNGLVHGQGSVADVVAEAKRLLARGFTTLKVKVGRR